MNEIKKGNRRDNRGQISKIKTKKCQKVASDSPRDVGEVGWKLAIQNWNNFYCEKTSTLLLEQKLQTQKRSKSCVEEGIFTKKMKWERRNNEGSETKIECWEKKVPRITHLKIGQWSEWVERTLLEDHEGSERVWVKLFLEVSNKVSNNKQIVT